MTGEGVAGPGSTMLRLENLCFLPFLVAEFEMAGVEWSADRRPGLAAHLTAKHGGDPVKLAAVNRACDAVLAADRAMEPAPAGDAEDEDGNFARRVAKALASPVVLAEIRRQIVTEGRANPLGRRW